MLKCSVQQCKSCFEYCCYRWFKFGTVTYQYTDQKSLDDDDMKSVALPCITRNLAADVDMDDT